jgi:hypothetical protein
MYRVDMDEDGQDEYLLVSLNEWGIGTSQFFYLADSGWRSGQLQHMTLGRGREVAGEPIENKDVTLIDPPFKDIRIGGYVLRPMVIEDQR